VSVSKLEKLKFMELLIFAFVLWGCKTWSFILREENTSRVFVNRVLPKKFGTKLKGISGRLGKME
jgi:hypothetical protein